MTRVPFYQHDLGQAELAAIAEVLAGPILTTGDTVARFEERFAACLGCRHAVGVTSCTGGLHLSLLALGIGPGDEVITTPLTFIATATAILEAGATPVLVDVEPATGNLDAAAVEQAVTPRTRAIIPVHLFGAMCDMEALRAIADRHGLRIIEDAAHCVEGRRDGVQPGQVGDTACFSFYATKNLARDLRLLRLHGMTKTAADRQREGYQHWDMVVLGWKYNLDNIQAAMLLPQLDRLHSNLERRERLARRYYERLSGIPGLSWPEYGPGQRHARHLFPVWVDGGRRDAVIAALQERGVGVVVNYRPIHLLTFFRERFGYRRGQFPVAERIGERTLSLPFYPAMPVEHVDYVCDCLREILHTAGRRAA